VFTGEKDNGEKFAILYQPKGVQWVFGEEARRFYNAVARPPRPEGRDAAAAGRAAPHGEAQSQAGGDMSATEAVAGALNAAASFAGAAAQLIGAVVQVLQWWEGRQYRLMDEAKFEEERRIPWTYDMIGRWVAAHQDGSHLDLQISHYLGRETLATLGALAENKKMAVPQSMLYDLEQIRSVVARLRMLLGSQFRALELSETFNINAIVTRSLGGTGPKTTGLNHGFVRQLASDPAEDWDRLLAANELKSFEAVPELARQPSKFAEKAFGWSVQEEKGSSTKDFDIPSWSPFVVGALAGALGLTPSLLGASLVATAVLHVVEKLSNDSGKRDDFRELALFAAEVERTRMLHRMWCMIDGMVRREKDSGILVLEDRGNLLLSLGARGCSAFEVVGQTSLEPSAIAAPAAKS